MSFDSVFNGDPNTPNVTSSGKATFGIDIATGQLYFKDDAVAGWQETAGGSGGSVTSDDVANESGVSGATVTDALDALNQSQTPSALFESFVIDSNSNPIIAGMPLGFGPNGGVCNLNNSNSHAILASLEGGNPGDTIQCQGWGICTILLSSPDPSKSVLIGDEFVADFNGGSFFTRFSDAADQSPNGVDSVMGVALTNPDPTTHIFRGLLCCSLSRAYNFATNNQTNPTTSLLNLKAGTGITLTAGLDGSVTIALT